MTTREFKAKLKRNRIVALLVGIAVIFVCIMLATEIISVRKKNSELEDRKDRLNSQIEEQLDRQAGLDADEDCVRTDEYIEERAKSIGYVYPDEIIFRKKD